MDFDEINDDDEKKKKLMDMVTSGKLGAVPDITHLPDSTKDDICRKVSHHCMELMMKTYVSMGIDGNCVIGAINGMTGKRYKMTFKTLEDGEVDEHLG